MLRRLGGILLAPLCALALAEVVLWLAAREAGADPTRAVTWCQGDSGLYLSVALEGYDLFPCPADGRDGPVRWCGNAGWLPGYPLVLRLLRSAGLRLRPAGRLVSLGSSGLVLVVLWTLFLRARPAPGGLLALVAAAVFPGAVYHHAVFPISLFTLLALLTLDAAARGAWLWAALAGAASAFTYTTGFLLAPLMSLAGWASPGPRRRRLARAALVGLAVASGFLAVLALQARALGAWDAFFRIQSTYGHGLHNPLATWWARLAEPWSASPGDRLLAPPLQTVLVAAWMLGTAAALWNQRALIQRREWLLAAYGLAFWLVPLVLGGGVALHRAEALLLPTAGLAPRMPRRLVVAFVVAAVALLFSMGRLFFASSLV